ncbi:hypothetical protein WJX72_011191 [[Myrmecia] bisecta]|uniref:Uncharacterized protein n=1 Tax=[Myrmecia] bisecta TaxID=41462 RepID=A0AAW1Q1S2_9CHLO
MIRDLLSIAAGPVCQVASGPGSTIDISPDPPGLDGTCLRAILDTATDKANGPPTLDLGAVTNSTQQPCKCPSVQPMRTLSVRALASLQPDCPSAAPSSQRPPYGQDPSIIYYGSLYIAADVDVGQRVFVRVSPTLSTLYSRGWQVVYTEPGTLFYTEAPSIHSFHDPSCDCNRFLIYYSSITYNVISVIRSDSDNPLGPWTYMGTLDGVKGYDATLMVHPRGGRVMWAYGGFNNPVGVSCDGPGRTVRMQEVSLLADGSVCLGVPRAYPGG